MAETKGQNTFPISRTRPLYRLSQIFIRSIFKVLCGLKVAGRENVPESGPFILASNHQSWFDPPIIGSTCPREVFYAAKRELFDNFILGPLVRYYNSIPVRRSGYDRTALTRLGEVLEGGNGVIIFPEGTRFLDGRLHSPKSGVGMLALKYNIPVVPVYISGSSKLRLQIFSRRLRVRFGRSFTMADIGLSSSKGKDGYRAGSAEVMRRIAAVGGVDPPAGLENQDGRK